jgi:hypothetical protein
MPGSFDSNDGIVGEEGRRYSIVVRNRSDLRLEIVLSLDGLDVIDGRPASLRKRGYILNPPQKLVEGFRQSMEAVAAFRFGPVRESYAAEKYHNTRTSGVIGIALFNEMGSDPWKNEEVRRRLKANPCPGRFATHPNGVALPPPLCIVREPCRNSSSRPTVAR